MAIKDIYGMITKRYDSLRKHILRNRMTYLLVLALAIMILVVLVAKFALYINFLLGNDIVLELGSDKTTAMLERGEVEAVTYDAGVTSNPFCNVECIYRYKDISSGTMLGNGTFMIKSTSPVKKIYNISTEHLGSGLEIYRFDLECHARSSFFCQTDGQPTTRSILFTLQYNLTEQDRAKKEQLRVMLQAESARLGNISAREDAASATISRLSQLLDVKNLTAQSSSLDDDIDRHHGDFLRLLGLWNKQDYDSLDAVIGYFMSGTDEIYSSLASFEDEINKTVSSYNSIGKMLESSGDVLENVSSMEFSDWNEGVRLANTIILYNRQVLLMEIPEPLETKNADITGLSDDIIGIRDDILDNIRTESLSKDVDADVFYDTLCNVSGICKQHPGINKRAAQTGFDLNMTCSRIDELNDFYADIRDRMAVSADNQSYPATAGFWKNISDILAGIRNDIAADDLISMRAGPNSGIIRSLLVKNDVQKPAGYPGLNLTPALVLSMQDMLPERCDNVDIRFDKVRDYSFTPFFPDIPNASGPVINISEPLPSCPVFGTERACCVDCAENQSLYPVLLLHGHAVNKDISAEYSLEGFNQIQQELEKDGFLNAGSITLFTPDTAQEGWSLVPVPLVFRGSYYFDIFGEPQNYVAVQAKSENIDTYAVRLNDLVDTVLKKTGRDKVRIVAFSMGGLVARRYIQIFGDSRVDRLVMIGTPNKGIVGEIADLCPLVGEDLECRDMDSNSLFINKLNRGDLPDIPIYNIVGTGCDMGAEQGDGAVLKENALLEGADNYIINGRCESAFSPLHLELRNIDKYPEVYRILLQSLDG